MSHIWHTKQTFDGFFDVQTNSLKNYANYKLLYIIIEINE